MSARSIPSAPTAVAAAVAAMAPYRQFICHACGWIYDEAQGDPTAVWRPARGLKTFRKTGLALCAA